jgi:predicted nucleic acid-binding protein
LEYEEIFLQKWGYDVTENLLGRLLIAENTQFDNFYFNFHSITGDVDDNKFADLFISSNADFLVSNVTGVLSLNKSEFPVFQVITLQEFSTMLTAKNKRWNS